MRPARRQMVLKCTMVAGASLAAFPGLQAAHAADYPEKTVRVLVGLAPGGGTDISARLLMQKLTQTLGQSFVVDNRSGAGSMLAAGLAARAAPDGYTLLFVSPEFAVNPSLQANVPYDVNKDFAPVVRVVDSQYFLSVNSGLPVSSVQELIALAKKRELTYASSGNGSANHLGGELFKTMAGINMLHVPYKGSGPSMTALLGNEVHVLFSSTTAIIPHVRTGKVKALAATGRVRSPVAPDVPTVAESGLPGFEVTGWFGLLAPARTPAAIVNRLNRETNRVLPELRGSYAERGTETVGGTPGEFAAFIRNEVVKWARVIKQSGAKPD